MRRYPPFDDEAEITPLRLPSPPRGTQPAGNLNAAATRI